MLNTAKKEKKKKINDFKDSSKPKKYEKIEDLTCTGHISWSKNAYLEFQKEERRGGEV